MADFWRDLRDHWDDHYWWLDHQLLMAILLALVGLLFHGLHLWMDRAWGVKADA